MGQASVAAGFTSTWPTVPVTVGVRLVSVADVWRSLQAGTDVALWVTTDEVPAVLDRLEKALTAGELKMADVNASVLRVAKFKGPKSDCGP